MKNKRFAIFILTHGRPDRQFTYNSLQDAGYTGDVYFLIDDEDKTADEYFERYGDKVIQFNKKEAAELFDVADTIPDMRAVVYARNAVWKIAKDLGLDYFAQFDDDYTSFMYRYPKDGKLSWHSIKSLDGVLDAMIDFLEDSGALSVATAQGGDHMGGVDGNIKKPLLRKVMNTWILKTDRQFEIVGKINEDTNTYVILGSRGDLFFTISQLQITQKQTQTNSGGLTDIYLENGTYVKSMYTVIMHPSSVTVRSMGQTHKRLHHNIEWDYTVPKIINEKYQKK